MIRQYFKRILYTLFKGAVLPVFNSQLKGLRLKVDPLMPGQLFWNDVETEVHSVYNICIKKGFVVLDIGANVGLHSYYISRRFENTSVYAFEPFPANAGYIREIISINKIKNITVVEKAVGASTGECYFDASINSHQGHITDQKAGLVVAMVSLDDFLSQHNLQPDLIKIDVEGGEAAVLNGFKKEIASSYPTIIVEIHSREQAKKVADFFRPLDYILCKLIPIKYLNNNAPLLLIDNSIDNPEAPEDINGQIVAIPKENMQAFSSFVRSS